MEKLPPTSYVRLVDIWLINGQLVPFLEVILLTVMELNRDGISSINHHGSARSDTDIRSTCKSRVLFRQVGPDEKNGAWADKEERQVNVKRLVKWMEMTEQKILPIFYVIFTIIYWSWGLYLFSV